MRLEIAGRPIGAGRPMFVIAEIGLNHGGSLDRALALVDAAAEAGASAVKLQTLHADGLVADSCPAPAHVQATSLREFFRTFELDEPAHHAVARRARTRGLAVLSTPFDERAVDLLERVGVDAYKIASGDLTHRRLIERVARTGRPLVLSTGMSDLQEVYRAVDWAVHAGARAIALLHCVSAYPVPEGEENLAAIATLARATGLPVGLSDHGTYAGAAAVAAALGASVYERHLVEDSASTAIDRPVSSTPGELRAIVAAAERARRALGDGRKRCLEAEAANLVPSRRGLYATRPLEPGRTIADGDLVALRPAAGIPASDVGRLVGCTLTRAVHPGEPLTWEMVAAREIYRAV
jgi:sialic acid synthase SpsE